MKEPIQQKLTEIIGKLMTIRSETITLLNEGINIIGQILYDSGTVSYPGTRDELYDEDELLIRYRIAEGKPHEGALREGFLYEIKVAANKPAVLCVVDLEKGKDAEVDFSDLDPSSVDRVLLFIDNYCAKD
jgi:hypothetical protein